MADIQGRFDQWLHRGSERGWKNLDDANADDFTRLSLTGTHFLIGMKLLNMELDIFLGVHLYCIWYGTWLNWYNVCEQLVLIPSSAESNYFNIWARES